MSEKQRNDIEFVYKNGYFRRFSAGAPLQMYQLCEREVSEAKALDAPLCAGSFFLLLCMSGSGTLSGNDQVISLKKDTVVFLRTGDEFTLKINENDSPLRYVLAELVFHDAVEPTIPSAIYTHFIQQERIIVSDGQNKMRGFFSELIAELCLLQPTTARVRGLLDQMLVCIYRSGAQKNQDTSTVEPIANANAVGHTVYAIIRYIDENLYTIHSLMDMAEKLGYSYNYLSHLFRRKTGMTIQNYFAQKKIEASRQLLTDNRYSITEISTMLNYDCIQSFSKAFKKAIGVSPTEFRASHGKRPE